VAKKKTKSFKVNYKGLVREIRSTLKTLKKISNKVGKEEKADIALQIKSLEYLEGVCASAPAKMSKCKMVAPKMSKCFAPPVKMSKVYFQS